MVVTSTYRKKQKKKRPNEKIPFRKEEIRLPPANKKKMKMKIQTK